MTIDEFITLLQTRKAEAEKLKADDENSNETEVDCDLIVDGVIDESFPSITDIFVSDDGELISLQIARD